MVFVVSLCYVQSSGSDFCYDPGSGSSSNGGSGGSSSNSNNLPNYKDKGSEYCDTHTCGLCEGDCDDDSQCEGDLICKQRNSGDSIPGCRGTPSSGK